jgi:hypothetical protein
MSEGKFIGYFRLIEACAEPGCPVCRCVIQDGHRYLDGLLYEQVTDVDTRQALRASWGFCSWHTWMLLEIPHSIFGSAVIHEDILKRALARTERFGDRARRSRRRRWVARLTGRAERTAARSGFRPPATCAACTTARDNERRYLETLARLGHEGDLQAAYARSGGLCAPHLFALLEAHEEHVGARVLIDETRAKWRKVGQELGSFVAKHDHRNRDPYTAEEAASCSRVFEILAGARGVFGNDLHPRNGRD